MATTQKPFRKGLADTAPPSDHDRLESLERRVANLAIAVVDQQQAMRNDAPPTYDQIAAAGGQSKSKPASAPSVHEALARNWRAVDALLTAVGELEHRLRLIPAPAAVVATTGNTMPPEPNCGSLLTELPSLSILSSRIEDQAVRLTAMTARLTL